MKTERLPPQAKLEAIHAECSQQHPGVTRFIGKQSTMEIILDNSDSGELTAATLVREGTVRYHFERDESNEFALIGVMPYQFASSHLYLMALEAERTTFIPA